ncbi:MAG: porin [Saprospiraceae bacterium]
MLLQRLAVLTVVIGFCTSGIAAQTPADSLPKPSAATPPAQHSAKWYEKISLRGYAQFRYNRLLETNPDLRCEQCDKSIGRNQGFYFRRARLIFSGQINPRFFAYLQFDYSADASANSKHFLQVRDAYFDYAFDDDQTMRVRIGQSKVPYGFDNLQSSSQRLPFDRSDAINSGAPNERDLGVFGYYAPKKIRSRFKQLVEEGLKGSGDYGIFGFGVYNGQSANKPEANDNLHVIARASYPFRLKGGQIIEPGVQAYSGRFTLAKDQLSSGVKYQKDATYADKRIGASLVIYPQPFGIQAEYNWGQSPSFDAATDSIRLHELHGGYITASWRTHLGSKFTFMPFVRYQTYDGAKKHETDARMYAVQETEIGVEWQVNKNLELTLAYMISHRKYQDLNTDYDERGQLLRVQVQANY